MKKEWLYVVRADGICVKGTDEKRSFMKESKVPTVVMIVI